MKKGSIALWLAVLVLFGVFVSRLEAGHRAEGRKQLEEAVRRGAVSCYALEGRYPETVEELKERFGLSYNEKRFAVHYEYTASNLMPQITVVEK